jgi:choline dehydrogenase-like flavoprotein
MTAMSLAAEPPDAIVIGSGPSGVSAARTLLEGGRSVLLLEAGDDCPAAEGDGTLGALRQDPGRNWPIFLGRDLGALDGSAESSPKLRTPRAARLGEQYLKSLRIAPGNFVAAGALAIGGLSNFWGAAASRYAGADLRGYPLTEADLAEHYRAVVARIGVSGSAADDLAAHQGEMALDGDLPVPAPIATLIARYARGRDALRAQGFLLGRARNAVLAETRSASRQGCALDNLCLWGCPRGAIYSSAFAIEELRRFARFRLERNVLVTGIAGANGAWRVAGEREGRALSVESGTVLIAAGTISTTRLVLAAFGWHEKPVRLLTNPVAAAGFFFPSLIGAALPERGFAMAQLQYVLEEPASAADYAAGALYLADGLPASELISRLPLTRPAARAIGRAMMPAMLLATCYLASDHSDNWLTLRRDGVLAIEGGHAPEAAARAAAALRRLRRALWRLGLVPVPGAAALSMPGSDFHYAGTLPMGGPGPLATTEAGELMGARGLYIVDGAALPRLPAKSPTLTIMANAARIAAGVVRRWNSESGHGLRPMKAEETR